MFNYNQINNHIGSEIDKILKSIATDYNLNYLDLVEKYNTKPKQKKKTRKRNKHNAYTAFLGDCDVEAQIKEENEGISFGELSKLKGEMWSKLTATEKEHYKLIAKSINEKEQASKV